MFKATIGLLVSKGRDKAADKLKDGDVTDQKIRNIIVREIDDIKSKLDGLARKDLLTSISCFRRGVVYLFQLLDKANSDKKTSSTVQSSLGITEEKQPVLSFPSSSSSFKKVSMAQDLQELKLTDLEDGDKRVLLDAKEGFKLAWLEATKAFNNETLSTPDRLQALVIRVAATILEKVDFPEEALAACRLCLEELHSMPAVQNSFKIELKKRLLNIKSRFSRDERREIISTVCKVNRAVFDVTQAVTQDDLWIWQSVDIGEEKLDPLRDTRVTSVMQRLGMDYCCVTPWSFSQEGARDRKVTQPTDIASNTDGQFVIADSGHKDANVKVFDSNGEYVYTLKTQTDNDDTEVIAVCDVGTDMRNNTYVLVFLRKPKDDHHYMWGRHPDNYDYDLSVQVFNSAFHHRLAHKFPVRGGRLTVTDSNKVNKGAQIRRRQIGG